MLRQFLLGNGTWVIGRVIDETIDPDVESHFVVEKARTIQMLQTEKGFGWTLLPLDITNPDGTIVVYEGGVVANANTISPELEEAYLQASTSLQLPKSH